MWAASVRAPACPPVCSAFFSPSPIVAEALAPGVRELGRRGRARGRERSEGTDASLSDITGEPKRSSGPTGRAIRLSHDRPTVVFLSCLLLHVLLWTCGRSDKQRPLLTAASPPSCRNLARLTTHRGGGKGAERKRLPGFHRVPARARKDVRQGNERVYART
ncbi:hypothetical protein CGRA01v4_01242 [Colletotrichum graminicola]|nr:hypothetical protein CGRA01v4_01242 [Colletotrichum graminicola]